MDVQLGVRLWRAGWVLSLLMLFCGTVVASQPTPPVAIDVTAMEGKAANEIIARLALTSSIPVSGTTLTIKSDSKDLKLGEQRRSVRLAVGKTQVIDIPIAVGAAGTHRIDIEVRGTAKGYVWAGGSERRYVVWDGKQRPRLLTGLQVRRELRLEVDRKLRETLRAQPDAGVSIDDFLRQPLQELKNAPPPDDKLQQALVPPPVGIEPYERDAIIDKTADVIRELDPLTITGRIFFTDRAGNSRPLINAAVDVRDSDTGPDEQLTTVITDWNGRFNAVVNNDDGIFQNGRDIYIRVRTSNSRFRVQDCGATPDWTYAWESGIREDLSDGTVVDFGNSSTGANNEASILFQDLNQGWNFLTTAGGQDPGFVDLCWPEDSSRYTTFWEEIDIEDGDEVSRDITLHEYGHATMHRAYGGDWPSDTGGPHGFGDVVHPNFAFTEGWGTFIALAINDDGVYDSTSFSQTIEGFNHTSSHTDGDGQENEGHVAAGLHDVRDRAADGSCASGGKCDPSGANPASMTQIWRDSFWNSDSDNMADYWPRLCGELNPAQTTAALGALTFNHMNLGNCRCVIELSLARLNSGERDVQDLRVMRDRALRNTALGQRVIDVYYRHTAEVSALLLKDATLRRMAATLFTRAAEGSRVLIQEKDRDGILLDAEHAKMAREFIARIQKAGSKGLKSDFEEVKALIDWIEGRSYEEVRQKFRAPYKPK